MKGSRTSIVNVRTCVSHLTYVRFFVKFALCGLPITKVGINFGSTAGNIDGWE